jgi:thiamine-phosphate pyrophosphorylase
MVSLKNKDFFALHFITNSMEEVSISEAVQRVLTGGCRCIQLRMKDSSLQSILYTAKLVKEMCQIFNARLIINDHIEIAKEVDADGVHVGKNDACVTRAREVLGENKIVGYTANTIDDILDAIKKEANYVGLGPFQLTKTKAKLSPILGLNGYKKILEQYNSIVPYKEQIPIVAIGGIRLCDV